MAEAVIYRCPQGHLSDNCAMGEDDTEAEGLPLCVECPADNAWEVERIRISGSEDGVDAVLDLLHPDPEPSTRRENSQ